MKTTSPALETYSMLIKGREFFFEVYNEEDLTWKQHNEIHRVLNLAYGYRTKAFEKKDFAFCIPKMRVLCRYQEKLVGHTALFESHLSFKKNFLIGGIGLTLNLMPHMLLGFVLRQKAVEICKKHDCLFAVGRVKNEIRLRDKLKPLVLKFLDIPLVGKNTISHTWETLAIYDTGGDKDLVKAFLDHCEKEGCIRIEEEIF